MSRGREQFSKYKKLIDFFTKIVCKFPLKIRKKLFEGARNFKGKKGIALRYIYLKTIAKSCGDNVAVFPGVYLLNAQNLSVGNNVSIQPMCYLECGNTSGITIGSDVSIAHGVSMIATNHGFDDPGVPIKDQPLKEEPIIIGNDVWIGAKVTVLAGKKIGERCVIAANAVITKDIEEHSLAGGVPAKIIKKI